MRGMVGAPSPYFALEDQYGALHTAAGYAGSALLIVFYPFAFSPICSAELASLNALAGSGPESESGAEPGIDRGRAS